MDLQDIFAKRLQKIDQLNNFISIFDKKKELFDELKSLNENVGDVREILMECSNCISRFQTVNQQRYTELMRRSREQQDKILDLLETMENQQPKFLSPKPHPSSARPALLENVQRMENFMTPVRKQFCDMGETPVMNFSDYIKSPFTSNRKRPISLQFADFERVISPDEFSKIPSYMKGRETHAEIQQFLVHVIIACFTAKYLLLPKRREAVPSTDIELWNLYKAQEEYFRGEKFITQGDLCRVLKRQLDKKTCNRITILRHLKILREERKNSTICYLWSK